MERFLIIFLTLFFTINAYAATPGSLPAAPVGGAFAGAANGAAGQIAAPAFVISPGDIDTVITAAPTSGKYFMLSASDNPSGTAHNVFVLRKNGTRYQVTSGKTCLCIRAILSSATANTRWQLFSDTVTFNDNATFASLTASVSQGGASQAYNPGMALAANSITAMDIMYVFGASTFPGVQIEGTSNNSIELWCKEQ